MFSNEKITELSQFLDTIDSSSKLFLGCDSVKHKKRGKWVATYTLVAVVHINNKHGCRVFAETVTEPDYDTKKDRPTMRLLNEAMKVAALYNQLQPMLNGREVEIHLDINSDEQYGSNHVVSQAVGYVMGMTTVRPMIKPDAWAATHVADRGARAH